MNMTEHYAIRAFGRIRLFEMENGKEQRLLLARKNVIAYTAADIMAKLVCGDTDAFPKHIGFLYGESATPASLVDPATLPLDTRRQHPWTVIRDDAAANTANMIVCPLVLPAAVSLDDDSDEAYYTANAATFTSHTGAFTEYAFSTTGGIYAGTLDSLAAIYFYQAVLLNRRTVGSTVTYTPFARVSLGTSAGSSGSGSGSGTNYVAKAVNRELAIYWNIVFK